MRILDHGSLIVGVPDVVNEGGRASRTLMYSCDVGTSWSPLMYTSNANLTIYGVRTEPGEITTVVTYVVGGVIVGVAHINNMWWEGLSNEYNCGRDMLTMLLFYTLNLFIKLMG